MSRKPAPKRRRKTQARRSVPRHGKVAPTPKKPQPARKRLPTDPRIEIAVREMNRGRSLTATARSLNLPPKDLQRTLRQQRLGKRKGRRWIVKDNRLRRVLVISAGRIRKLIVRGYGNASLAGEHYNAAGAFVSSNDVNVIDPFRGRSVTASNGRRYLLETDPNALHRIAAIDSAAFHEIYAITSNT